MNPSKRRFKTEAEIMAEIDKYRIKSRELLIEAESLDQAANLLVMIPAKREEVVAKREYARHLRARATTILESRLPKLGEKLSIFRTGQIPALDNGDASILADLRKM